MMDLNKSFSIPSTGYQLDKNVKRAILEGQRLHEHPLILEGGMNNSYVNHNEFLNHLWGYEVIYNKELIFSGGTFNNLSITKGLYWTKREPVKWVLSFKGNKANSPYNGIEIEGKGTNNNTVNFILDKKGHFVEWSLLNGEVYTNLTSTSELLNYFENIYLTYCYHPNTEITANTPYVSPIYNVSGSMIHTLLIYANSSANIIIRAFQSSYWNKTNTLEGFVCSYNPDSTPVTLEETTIGSISTYGIILPISLEALGYVVWEITSDTTGINLAVIWHAEHAYI